MGKKYLTLIVAGISAMTVLSCGGPKIAVQEKPANPFGDVYEAPCTVYDTPEEFAATGIYRGSMNQKGEVHKHALHNAQNIIRMKARHVYKGMISDFEETLGNNGGNDIQTKVSMAGDQIIDAVIDNTSEFCTKFGTVADDGHIECYVAIKIPKSDLSEKIAEGISTILTDEEKMDIRFNEYLYRKELEKRFQNYKEK